MNNAKIKQLQSSGLLTVAGLCEIVDKIHLGGCVVLPSDTGYMMACDATNEDAIQRIFKIKKRKLINPIHVSVGTVQQAYQVGKFSTKAERLLDTFLPGALTIIVPKQDLISDLLVANTGNIGIRIPDEPCIIQICSELNKPITATSVNYSDTLPLTDFDDIITTFGSVIDFAVRSNKDKFLKSSTVVRVINNEVEVLRDGPISREAIFTAASIATYSDYREFT